MGYYAHPVKAEISTPVRALCDGVADFTHVYQNTTGRPVLCIISALCESGGVVIGEVCRIIGATENDPAPHSNFVYGGWQEAPANDIWMSATIIIAVPSDWYYRVIKQEGANQSVGLHNWVEVEL